MKSRLLTAILAPVVLVAGATMQIHAQGGSTPRTPDGQPDLQGTWSYATLTPLERPKEFAGKSVLSADEAETFAKQTFARRDNDRRDDDPTRTRARVNGGVASADVARAYNQFWWDFGTKGVGNNQSSLIVDPPNGRLPALSVLASKRQQDRGEAGERPAAGPEDRSLGERCIIFVPRSGPPMTPSAYNNNFQLVQTKNEVAIYNEQAHDVRIIPLDGRPHLPGYVRQWRGDGRGHFEGDTLVVETTNYRDDTNFLGSGMKMHLIERFRLAGPNELSYSFTVTDPESFASPFTVHIPMPRTDGQIYEYACHEGNYGMFNLLSGARASEREAAEAAKKGSN